jgi:hypothetical protein
MRMAAVAALAMALLLASSATAAPEVPGGDAKIAPDPDITPSKPMGAQARAKNGPDPLAAPPSDAGMTPDPDEAPVPERAATPAQK